MKKEAIGTKGLGFLLIIEHNAAQLGGDQLETPTVLWNISLSPQMINDATVAGAEGGPLSSRVLIISDDKRHDTQRVNFILDFDL